MLFVCNIFCLQLLSWFFGFVLEVLGLAGRPTEGEARKAYHNLSRLLHPDKVLFIINAISWNIVTILNKIFIKHSDSAIIDLAPNQNS